MQNALVNPQTAVVLQEVGVGTASLFDWEPVGPKNTGTEVRELQVVVI